MEAYQGLLLAPGWGLAIWSASVILMHLTTWTKMEAHMLYFYVICDLTGGRTVTQWLEHMLCRRSQVWSLASSGSCKEKFVWIPEQPLPIFVDSCEFGRTIVCFKYRYNTSFFSPIPTQKWREAHYLSVCRTPSPGREQTVEGGTLNSSLFLKSNSQGLFTMEGNVKFRSALLYIYWA